MVQEVCLFKRKKQKAKEPSATQKTEDAFQAHR